jgi:hypothetical protein
VTLEAKPGLRRTLQLDSPTPQKTWFRALTGKITSTAAETFATPEIRLTISPTPSKPLLREAPTVENAEKKGDKGANKAGDKAADKAAEKPPEPEQELIIPLDLPQGKTQLTIDYVPLR